jgi:nickel transport system ATP-binding protein
LLNELRATLGLSYLFITHDIKAAYMISDSLSVLDKRQVAEYCENKEQFLQSSHPAVKGLLGSMLPEHPRYRSRGVLNSWQVKITLPTFLDRSWRVYFILERSC